MPAISVLGAFRRQAFSSNRYTKAAGDLPSPGRSFSQAVM